MRFARAVPRVASQPELRSFECRVCGIVTTTEDTRVSLYGAPCCQAEIGVAERTVSSLILASIVDRLLRWDGRRFQGGALAYGDWRHWGRAAEQPCIRSVR